MRCTTAWSTPANWDTNVEPTTTDDVVFPINKAGAITLATGEKAQTLQFDDTYTLSAGGLTLSSASTIHVVGDETATISTPLTVTGGTTKTGTGLLLLNGSNTFTGGINLSAGSLQIGHANAIGTTTNSATVETGTALVVASGISFDRAIALKHGGILAGRAASTTAINFTGSPGNNLLVTAGSSLLSDRTTATAGTTFTFGSLSIGSHTLTVGPGPNATSGTAAIITGSVTLTGDPLLAVNDLGSTAGKLTTGSWLGGGTARTITKTGAGDLTVTGGSTDLPAGSQFAATGGGTIEMWFPALGTDATVNVTAAQNPFGAAAISVTGGALRLLANGSGTTAVQTYVVPSAITLGGAITLDPDRQSGSNSNKTFQIPGLTLAADTDLTIAGDNTHGIALTGALALQGNATLRGSSVTSKNGLLTLGGGITGGGLEHAHPGGR